MGQATGTWWRIEADPPGLWSWEGFAVPRHRFDPPSGRFRVRYAASDILAATRERFPSRVLGGAEGRLLVIRLETDELSALHLTHQANLDALDLDDRISTGRLDRLGSGADPLLSTCQALSDAVFDWWEGAPPPLVYRTRTLPAARSMAFTRAVGWTTSGSRRLSEATGLLAALVTRHGFTVPGHWLA